MHDFLQPVAIEVMLASEEGRRALNASITNRLDAITGGEQDITLRFASGSNSGVFIDITRATAAIERERVSPFEYLPDSFSDPAYAVQIYSPDTISVSTPYSDRPLPSLVFNMETIEAFGFENFHYFDDKGNSAIACRITKLVSLSTDEKYHTVDELTKDHLPPHSLLNPKQCIDFLPAEEDSGLMEMTVQDYHRILLHLSLIESGQFTLESKSDASKALFLRDKE